MARLLACGFFTAAFQPREQIDVRRRQSGPEDFDVLGIGAVDRRQRGFRQSRRHADPQCASDQLDQRPASGFIERIEPARQPRWQLGLAQGRQRLDHSGERYLFATRSTDVAASGDGHISATVSERSPT